jgi:hypothetical protein
MLLTVHVQVDLAKRRRERTGSYPDAMELSEQPLAVKIVVQFGLYVA